MCNKNILQFSVFIFLLSLYREKYVFLLALSSTSPTNMFGIRNRMKGIFRNESNRCILGSCTNSNSFTRDCYPQGLQSLLLYHNVSPEQNVIQRIPLSLSVHCVTTSPMRPQSSRLFSSVSQIHDKSDNDKKNQHDEDSLKQMEITYQELKQLSNEILHHDSLYYTAGFVPEISDDEYDALTKREAEICKLYPNLKEKLERESGLGSKATRYGGRVGPLIQGDRRSSKTTNSTPNDHEMEKTDDRGRKVVHLENAPMQSLDNAMNTDDVVKWLNRVKKILLKQLEEQSDGRESIEKSIDIIAEPKLDGLSLSLRYGLAKVSDSIQHYTLQTGATRGDGRRGEDITNAIMTITKAKNDNSNDNVNSSGMIPIEFTLNTKDDSKPQSSPPEIIEVRGEIILPKTTFNKLMTGIADQKDSHEQGSLLLSQFSNARNAASGILLRRKSEAELTVEEVKNTNELRSSLRFYAYSIAFSAGPSQSNVDNFYSNGQELRDMLSKIGFTIPNPSVVTSIALKSEGDAEKLDCSQLMNYHVNLMRNRDNLSSHEKSDPLLFDFDIDGAVYKVSSIQDRTTLGSSSRYPRWAIAHKFPAKCAVSKLKNVDVQVGRTGALTPVAILDPTDLGGVIVSRASLHNFMLARSILEADDNGDVNKDTFVMISRAGDVIPQVLRRINSANETVQLLHKGEYISLSTPKTCPACGAPTYYDDLLDPIDLKKLANDTIASGQVLRCGGPQLLCPPRAVGALSHAYSRDALDVVGLSEGRLQQLMNASLIEVPSDLFKILDPDSTMKDEISKLPFWGEKSAQNLMDATQLVAKNGVSLSKFIYSLGIRHIGVHSSKLISSAYGSAEKFFDDVEKSKNAEECFNSLTDIKGVGHVMIESLIKFSSNEELVVAAKELAARVPIHDEIKLSSAKKDSSIPRIFEGKSVVFTGSLPKKMSRSTAQNIAVEVLGAKSTPSSISKSTGIVVEGSGGGKKAKEAKMLGIEIISAEDFVNMIEGYKFMN